MVERKYDTRRQNWNYAIIKVYDINTGKVPKLTTGTRYFTPSLSEDRKNLGAVEVSKESRRALVLIDVTSGEVLKRFSTPENYFLTYPAWSDDGEKIINIFVGDKGKWIAHFDVESDEVEYLTEFSYTEISKAVMRGDQVLFTGSYSGIDNLYVLDIPSKRISKIPSVAFGLTDPLFSPEGNKALFANYTSDDFEIAELNLLSENWEPFERVRNNDLKLYETIAAQDGQILDQEKIPAKSYEKKYSKIMNLFKFHSWAPHSIDASSYDVNLSVSILSQNLLSSSFNTLGHHGTSTSEQESIF